MQSKNTINSLGSEFSSQDHFHPLEHLNMGPYKVRSLVCNSIYSKNNRNGPPSANQAISTTEPFWVHPPTFPYPTLSAKAEPISKGHSRSDIMKLKVS